MASLAPGEREAQNFVCPGLVTGGEALANMLSVNTALLKLDVRWNQVCFPPPAPQTRPVRRSSRVEQRGTRHEEPIAPIRHRSFCRSNLKWSEHKRREKKEATTPRGKSQLTDHYYARATTQ